MTIHSAADHGYSQPTPPVREVRIGDTFRQRCDLGVYESRVLRPHRNHGYYETVFDHWVTDVPAFRQGFVGTIEIMATTAILAAMNAA